MKSIGQLVAEALPSVPIRLNGRPDENKVAGLIWEKHCSFWVPIRSALDPRGT